MTRSDLEAEMAFLLKVHKIPTPTMEWKFHPERRFRFDFAWPEVKVALEIEGGTWVAGAHTRGKHFESDCEKYNLAGLLGWMVIRATTDQVKDGKAIEWISRALTIRGLEERSA